MRSLLLPMATTLLAQCWIKTAKWDWSLSYWNFREIALQNNNSTTNSYKVSQIPYSPVPNIFIESQSFQQQNMAPTQHNSPQNTVSVWLQEINDRLSNLITKKKKWNLCAKFRSYKSLKLSSQCTKTFIRLCYTRKMLQHWIIHYKISWEKICISRNAFHE